MTLSGFVLVIAALAGSVALFLGWEFSGRWEFLSSRAQRRLAQAETPILQESTLDHLPAGSLERRLREAGWRFTPLQFRAGSLLLGLVGIAL